MSRSDREEARRLNLREVFLGLQDQMVASLSTNREVIQHPGTKGDATELQWLKMLDSYAPKRYCADKAFVVDCQGKLSQQIDVVIYDRQYSPFPFNQDNARYVPAESVYAVFEVKQELNAMNIRYAAEKAATVRQLRRTSARIPHAGGTYKPKKPPRIIAGILTLGCEWSPPFGDGFEVCYQKKKQPVVEHGTPETALIFFFLRLLARLQECGTVPAVDFNAYGRVL